MLDLKITKTLKILNMTGKLKSIIKLKRVKVSINWCVAIFTCLKQGEIYDCDRTKANAHPQKQMCTLSHKCTFMLSFRYPHSKTQTCMCAHWNTHYA